MEIHSAPWIVPVVQPIIGDGGVLVDGDGCIVDLGLARDIRDRYPTVREYRHPCVLMPSLVNTHIHLELSHLDGIPPLENGQDFTDWVEALITRRELRQADKDGQAQSLDDVLRDQYDQGVGLLCDIGNNILDHSKVGPGTGYPETVRLLELIAPTSKALEDCLQLMETTSETTMVTGHAPYSTAPELLKKIKKRSGSLGHPFSLHVAESGAESLFIREAAGCFRHFLERRDSWDTTLDIPVKHGATSSVDYLDRLALLDHATILVHCVHVSGDDLACIASRGASVCLCPGSNRYLAVGTAPVSEMVNRKINLALGTDSAASNSQLDMWREMKLLKAQHHLLQPNEVITMATYGGARALGQETQRGFLGPGARGGFLSVSSPALQQAGNAEEILQELVTGGRPEITWVNAKRA